MKTSKKGIEFIKASEAFRSAPYLDSVGKPTIGFGSTYYSDGRAVTMKDKSLTYQEALDLFAATLVKYEDEVNKRLRKVLNQNQFDALVSLCYNIGGENFRTSTLLKRVNGNPEDPDIKNQFARWNKGRVKGVLTVLKGLTIRREKEVLLYFTK